MADVLALIEECGFDCIGSCPATKLRVREQVRSMCSSAGCGMYGKNWACPPACGTIEDFQKLIDARSTCYVMQSVAELEDEFDFDTMEDTEHLQKQRFFQLVERLAEEGVDAMCLSAGACTICPKCTCPDEPCRFPEKRFVSMESSGLVVTEVCQMANIPYNHGQGTIAYSSCILI